MRGNPATNRRRRAFRPDLGLGLGRLEGRELPAPITVTPALIRAAYSENFSFYVGARKYPADGAGQTIAIVVPGAAPDIRNDILQFDRRFNLPAPRLTLATFPGAQNNSRRQYQAEAATDVEWSHAVAPGAKLLLVQATSINAADLVTAIDWARRQPGVSVVSMSFASAEAAGNRYWDNIFMTPPGHTGVTFVAAAGDTGAWTNQARTDLGTTWPASVPTVVSVGGTVLSIDGAGRYLGESAWSSGGGGYSQVYGATSYQAGLPTYGRRNVPDVSYNAVNYTLYSTAYGGWVNGVSGTSVGTPQVGALIAIANEGRALGARYPLHGPSQTLPALYQFAADFRDVTAGSNGYPAGRGYDVATGLGSPIAVRLVRDLVTRVPSQF